MSASTTLSSIILLTLSAASFASQQIIIIGGGPDLLESQVSIEINTRWIIDIINQRGPDLISHILYTDGNQAGPDVHKPGESKSEIDMLEPLARVYNMEAENSYQYYSSSVSENAESTIAEHTSSTLQQIFSGLKENDEALIIFQGHGGHNQKDTSKNYLRFWNDTRMTVTELEKLMSEANPNATIRFILPQCFSGAFSKLIYKNAEIDNGLANGQRCGFLAQSEHRGSEGCTASVDTNTYRDYSSYFFSAIYGKAINGDMLTEDPDTDNDGAVSFNEAHAYTLANALSVDVSRSTSDEYLANWQPWYLRWIPDYSEPRNIYSKISNRIAMRFHINGQGKELIANVAQRLKDLNEKIEDYRLQQDELKKKIAELQGNVQKALTMRWPLLAKPYTKQYRDILINEVSDIYDTITQHADYAALVDNQEQYKKLEHKILDVQREEVQMTKILRMRKLATLLNQFQTHASSEEMAAYERLKTCENGYLFE